MTKVKSMKMTMSVRTPGTPDTKAQTEAHVKGFIGRNRQFLRIVRALKGAAASFEDGLTAAREISAQQMRKIGKLKRLLFKHKSTLAEIRSELDALAYSLPAGDPTRNAIQKIREKIKVAAPFPGAWAVSWHGVTEQDEADMRDSLVKDVAKRASGAVDKDVVGQPPIAPPQTPAPPSAQ